MFSLPSSGIHPSKRYSVASSSHEATNCQINHPKQPNTDLQEERPEHPTTRSPATIDATEKTYVIRSLSQLEREIETVTLLRREIVNAPLLGIAAGLVSRSFLWLLISQNVKSAISDIIKECLVVLSQSNSTKSTTTQIL